MCEDDDGLRSVLEHVTLADLASGLDRTTLACLLVQLVPVAPPRMYPGYGFVRCPFRSISIRPWLEIRFEDRLQDEL